MQIVFQNATVVNPEETRPQTVVVRDEKFCWPNRPVRLKQDTVIDASEWLLFPGLINIHDHLRGTWLPRCGNGPYENVYDWLRELHASPSVFAPAREREQIAEPLLYRLGAYKNLFSGATTVVDHYKRQDPGIYEGLPIRLITDFGREGVVRSFRDPRSFPCWGDGIVREYRECGGVKPFIIHVEEGFDEETGTELRRLERLGVLGSNSILIHGIGFDEDDIETVQRHGCHMVWCPATHRFLYGRTANISRWLEMGINTTLGTDSSLTGGLNLFDEMRQARAFYQETFGQPLDPRELFRMVTANPARALMLDERIGRIAPGYAADLLVLPKRGGQDPFETLLAAEPKDIILLLHEGQPRIVDEALSFLFGAGATAVETTPIVIAGRSKHVIGNPVALLEAVWEQIGRRYHPEFLPFENDTA